MLSKFESTEGIIKQSNIHRLAHELNLTSQYQAKKLQEASLDIGIIFFCYCLTILLKKWLKKIQEQQNQKYKVQISIWMKFSRLNLRGLDESKTSF